MQLDYTTLIDTNELSLNYNDNQIQEIWENAFYNKIDVSKEYICYFPKDNIFGIYSIDNLIELVNAKNGINLILVKNKYYGLVGIENYEHLNKYVILVKKINNNNFNYKINLKSKFMQDFIKTNNITNYKIGY